MQGLVNNARLKNNCDKSQCNLLRPFPSNAMTTIPRSICRKNTISDKKFFVTSISTCQPLSRRTYTRRTIVENDVVLLRHKRADSYGGAIITPPLKEVGKAIKLQRGKIDQRDILGKGIRDIVSAKGGDEYRIHEPTLDEYVRHSPRIVTPIYPVDANLIVSLLDLHPTAAGSRHDNGEKLEIFEAGTGHGALTLYLARAVHLMNNILLEDPGAHPDFTSIPANPFVRFASQFKGDEFLMGSEVPKYEPLEKFLEDFETSLSQSGGNSTTNDVTTSTQDREALHARAFQEFHTIRHHHAQQAHAYEDARNTRRAIIQTLDVSQKHSDHAKKVIRNYKQGMYSNSIDFHVGTIPDYLESRLSSSAQPFLDHAILDLPGPHEYLEILSKCVKPNGTLLLFCPSITQINTAVKMVGEARMSWLLETVLEIGGSAGVGGREWDVRAVRPRALLKAEAEKEKAMASQSKENGEHGEAAAETMAEIAEQERDVAAAVGAAQSLQGSGREMVCRPKVGGKISGGGFLAVFRAMQNSKPAGEALLGSSS